MSNRPDASEPRPASSSNPPLTANETAWIEFLRLITADSDPAPTLARIQRLRALLQEEEQEPPLDVPPIAMERPGKGEADPPARPRRLAILFDSENISSRSVPRILEEAAKLGVPAATRCYGNFSAPQLKRWWGPIAHYALEPRQQFNGAHGKNAADIAMVLDAMDLLHQQAVDGFFLVTSDSDLAPLARRIRNDGLPVYGFGSPATPINFQMACTRFTLLDNSRAPVRRSRTEAAERITAALTAIRPENEWVPLTTLGMKLHKLDPEWNPRSYGVRKLVDLISQLDEFFELNVSLPGAVHARLKANTD